MFFTILRTPLPNQDVDKCMLNEENTECACRLIQNTARPRFALHLGHENRSLYVICAHARIRDFTIRGMNFGTKVDHVEVFLGNMSLKNIIIDV